METILKYALVGFVIGYFLLRLMNKKEKKPINTFSDVLNNKDYEVKGQWDK